MTMMTRIRHGCALLFLGAALAVIASCQSSSGRHSSELNDHPLRGVIWDVQGERAISYDELLRRVLHRQFVLLGEVHDNLEHHRIQADVLRAIVANGYKPALAMEQFDRVVQGAIDTAQADPGASPHSIAEAGEFDRKGWKWNLYQPLVALAVQSDLRIAGTNLTRGTARRIASSGLEVLGETRMAELGLTSTWNAERNKAMEDLIIAGHCGKVPASVLPQIVSAQRIRDAIMAEALLMRGADGAVGILGSGHARRDLGVPLYLAAQAPSADIVTIALVEVDNGRNQPQDYEEARAQAGRYDVVWFTSRTPREDPCRRLVIGHK